MIAEPQLRQGVVDIWREIAAEMPWNDLRLTPKNGKTENDRTLVEHIRGVTCMALAIAQSAKDIQGREFDRDLLLAGALLHDVSKLLENEPDPTDGAVSGAGIPTRKSRLGRNVQHGVYAAHKMFEKRMPVELIHTVVTHTNSSNTKGQTWEAAAIFYADFAESDAALSARSKTMFLQRWHINK
ncbi:putative nucleotidyltransferase with HDIG domain [Aminobacter niigataensis]|uniref:Nucleotidyltransferase with HDIG domain n=1 Tax=Aminobacter niigataensis TaxID=83265 RepID=A0ABR6L3I5_9HYPH|nr:HD domain-containing protein [Aminobacter niigataensis]MBB4650581.1 putative nucleotidyltransferase with HDIG domain [Aminobacter niigataensis]